MYCPNCGAESTFGLNYCKHCGGNLSDSTQPAAPPARNIPAALILAAATVAIVLGGLAIVLSHTLALVGPQPLAFSQPTHEAIRIAGMIVVFGSAAIVVSTLMLIRLFARVMGFGSVSDSSSNRAKAFRPEPRAPQINAPPIAMQSVTEHTTRNFEPRVYQRNTRD